MTELPKSDVPGMYVSHCDYASACDYIVRAAQEQRGGVVTASAVHLVMEAYRDPDLRRMVNSFDLVTPDGQPVRWALNILAKAGLKDRVYGPRLTLELCGRAAREGLGVYFYGSTPEVVERLTASLGARYARLKIVGAKPHRFRPATPSEDQQDIDEICRSGAQLVFVGLGCPRQERWAFAHREALRAVLVCVGAAFDFHAGALAQAPASLQALGLEWAFRLAMEPRRLWRRYLLNNPLYVALVAGQLAKQRLKW